MDQDTLLRILNTVANYGTAAVLLTIAFMLREIIKRMERDDD